MQLDKFLISKIESDFCLYDSDVEEMIKKWSSPVNLSLFDTVKLTEQECNDRFPQI